MNVGDLLTKRGDVAGRLEKSEQELNRKRGDLALAILAGGDVDKLTGEIDKLEARVKALQEAATLAGKLGAEQAAEDGLSAAVAELDAIDAELAGAVLEAVRDLYTAVDRLEALKVKYGRAHGLMYSGPYAGRLACGRISQSWGVLSQILNYFSPLRRQIEMARPDLVAAIGEVRRFR